MRCKRWSPLTPSNLRLPPIPRCSAFRGVDLGILVESEGWLQLKRLGQLSLVTLAPCIRPGRLRLQTQRVQAILAMVVHVNAIAREFCVMKQLSCNVAFTALRANRQTRQLVLLLATVLVAIKGFDNALRLRQELVSISSRHHPLLRRVCIASN